MANLRALRWVVIGGMSGAMGVAALMAGCSGDDNGGTPAEGGADSTSDVVQTPDTSTDTAKESAADASKGGDAVATDGGTGGDAKAGDATNGGDATGSDAQTGDASDAMKGGDATDAPSEANTIPPGLLAYPGQHAAAFCSGISKCCAADAGAFSQATCKAAWVVGGWDNTTLPNTTSIYDAGHLTFNATQAAACVAALNGFTCTTGPAFTPAQYAAITNACLGVLGGTIPIGTRGCTSSWECASGSWCNLNVDGGSPPADAGDGAAPTPTGVCTALLATGAACTLDEMCSYVGTQKPASFCQLLGGDGGVQATGTCQAAQADNAPCGDVNQGAYFDDQACTSQLCGDPFTCGTNVTIPTSNFCGGYPPSDGGTD